MPSIIPGARAGARGSSEHPPPTPQPLQRPTRRPSDPHALVLPRPLRTQCASSGITRPLAARPSFSIHTLNHPLATVQRRILTPLPSLRLLHACHAHSCRRAGHLTSVHQSRYHHLFIQNPPATCSPLPSPLHSHGTRPIPHPAGSQPPAHWLSAPPATHPPPATVCLSTVHDPLVMHVRSHVPVTCPFSGAGPSPPSTCCLGTARPRLPATSPRQVPSVSLSSPALCPCHLPVFCPSTAGPSVHCHLPSCHCTDAHRPTSFLPLAS